MSAVAAAGADAVMVGRAAVGRPWLGGGIAAALRGEPWAVPPLAARRDAALAHLDALLDAFGPESGNRHARKHLVAYAEHLAPELAGDAAALAACAALRAALATSDDHRATRRMLGRLFDLPADLDLAA